MNERMNDSLENLLFHFANFSEKERERERAPNGRDLELKLLTLAPSFAAAIGVDAIDEARALSL